MEIRKINISEPVMGEEEWNALREPLSTGWLTQGPKVREFERLFAHRHQVKHAIAVTSCTTALHLSLLALGIKPEDEVIVPAFTWVSTANAVLYCGATPVFADISPDTFNIEPAEIRKKLTSRTKAIIAVHLFGLCADVDAIKAAAPGIPVVEDGACAAGASYKGKPCGGLGAIACFSFHPRKSITTGEGGMITTDNDDLAKKADVLRNHGASVSEEQRHRGAKPYLLPEFDVVGYNYRMTDLQGALGIVQLGKLDIFINERNRWADFYRNHLKDITWLITPKTPDGHGHGWQAFVTMVDEASGPMKRNELMEYLLHKGIHTRPGTHAVHMLGYYSRKYGIQPSDFPHAREANDKSMALPLHNKMSQEDYEYIVETLKSIG